MASPAAVLQVFVNANTKVASAQLAAFDRQLTGVGKTSAATGASMGKMTKGAAAAGAGIAAFGVVAVAAGKQLYQLGQEFDNAYDTIRVRTGATGRELKRLQSSFENVAKNVPSDLEDVGVAIGDLNTRLGLTGKPLERMAENVLHLSQLTGDDLEGNIKAVARSFVDWEVTIPKQTRYLDGMFRVSQASGASIAELADQVQKFGSPLRQLGFDFDEAISMFASFERAGVNTQTMVPGLKLAISNLTRPTENLAAQMSKLGVEAGKPDVALRQIFKLLGSGSTLSQIEKTGLAMDVFGKRAGADMAEAIKQGRFELDRFLKIFRDDQGDTIRGAAKDTYDFSENMRIFANRMKVLVRPAAMAVFNALGKISQALASPFVNRALKAMGRVFKATFDGIVFAIRPMVKGVRGGFNAVSDAARAVSKVFKSIVQPIRSALSAVSDAVRNRLQGALRAAVSFVNGIINVLNKIPTVDIKPVGGNYFGEGSSQRGRAAGLQRGGFLMGGRPSGDSIPAMLERGEYVLNREAVKKIGLRRLNDLNFKQASRFQVGGPADGDREKRGLPAGIPSLAGKAFGLLSKGPGAFIDLLPKPNLPQPIAALGPWLIDQVSGWIKDKVGGLMKATGGGSIRNYPMLSGDTDFLPALGMSLSKMAKATGQSIFVQSGFRSYAEQAALYEAYINGTGNLAAPPGSSNHESGRAADITPGREVFGAVANKFGLGFTVPSESWHIELMRRGGAVGMQKGGFVGNINKIWGEHNSGYGDWGGPTLPSYVVAALAQAAGMPGVTMEQVTRGESGAHAKGTARPGATGIDPGGTKGHGLWMITSGYNEDLAAKVGGWGKMLNPVINAWAASQIYRRQGLGAWYGTGSVTGNGINYSGNYDIANALGGLGYRGALYMATDGGLGEKPKSIEALRKGAAKALDRVRALRGRGAKGFLDAAVGNAREASKLAGEGEVTRAKSRLQKARAQIRKAVRAGKKPSRPGGGGGGGAAGAATPAEIAETVSLEQNRAIIAQLDEKISLFERSAGAEWSPAGGDYDQTEIDGLRALYVQLRDAYVLQRDLVEAEIRRVEEMIQRRKENIGEIVQKIRQWQIDIGVLQDSIRGGISEEQAKKWRERIAELEDKLKKGGTANQKEAWREEIKTLRGKLSGPSEEDKKRWKKQIEKIRGFISSGQTNMGNHNTFIEDARSIIEDNLRPELEDLIGVTGESGLIGDTNWEILNLDKMVPGSPNSPADGDSEIADLLRQQLQETQRALAISQAQMPIFQQFMPRFHQGGIVQGPMGAERPVMAQAGEGVFTRDQMRAMGSQNITVVIEDAAIDSNRIRVEVDGVIQDKVSTVRRQGSNRKFVTSR